MQSSTDRKASPEAGHQDSSPHAIHGQVGREVTTTYFNRWHEKSCPDQQMDDQQAWRPSQRVCHRPSEAAHLLDVNVPRRQLESDPRTKQVCSLYPITPARNSSYTLSSLRRHGTERIDQEIMQCCRQEKSKQRIPPWEVVTTSDYMPTTTYFIALCSFACDFYRFLCSNILFKKLPEWSFVLFFLFFSRCS